jgi:hypothetical protein
MTESDDSSVKKVAIIGANEFQNPLILAANARGYETHVFAWQDGSIGERTASHFYPISIVDIDLIVAKCRGNRNRCGLLHRVGPGCHCGQCHRQHPSPSLESAGNGPDCHQQSGHASGIP